MYAFAKLLRLTPDPNRLQDTSDTRPTTRYVVHVNDKRSPARKRKKVNKETVGDNGKRDELPRGLA